MLNKKLNQGKVLLKLLVVLKDVVGKAVFEAALLKEVVGQDVCEQAPSESASSPSSLA